ncbi:MAG TPA: DEAD/DEAH box helicase [Bryobacteraceae bacterium]|nr:DEAD/DEAH box helicase [Bryobacteraceae bacterium]
MKTFTELSLSARLQSNLAHNNFTEPTTIQALSIEPALAGKDLIATAQTGTGKTLAFTLPMIEQLVRERAASSAKRRGPRAIVLSPTRELALQIHQAFLKLADGTGVRAAAVVGGLGESPQLKAIRQGAEVVIATPGRLYDFLTRKLVDLTSVRLLVLDEADRMLDMGFLPTITRMIDAMPAERQTLLFSATIESSVKHLVGKYVRDAVRIETGSTTAPAENIELHSYEVAHDGKFGLLQHLLNEQSGPVLVFARTKHGADKLAKRLSQEGVKTSAIHGDRSQNQRNQSLRGFQDGYYRVLVATDVAARGIHVDGIAHVINYDLPQAPEDFIHRAGRTARAGASGVASQFYTPGERSEMKRIERTLSIRFTRKPVPGGSPVIVMPVPAPNAQTAEKQPQREFQRNRRPRRSFTNNRRRTVNGR